MIVLIHPASRESVYQGLAEDVAAIEPPIWCRLLSSYLEQKGVPTLIMDTQFANNIDGAAQECLDAKPSVVAVVVYGQQPSASTQTMPAAIEICAALDRHNDQRVPIVVLGTHPAALPEQTLQETGADFVCTGDGFVSLFQIHQFAQQARWQYLVRPDFPLGACYWDHDEPVRTNPAELVWDMAEIPGGEWPKLPAMARYRAHNWHCFGHDSRHPYASIYTSLGCPYACSFCCIQAAFREGDERKFHGKANSYRLWSAQHVVDEIETLAERGVRHIKISDEMFLLNRRHVESICVELKRRSITDMNIWFYSRVDTVGTDNDLLGKMRAVGFRWAALGIESASAASLEAVDKRDYSNEQVFASVRRLQSNGINVIGNYIFGLPEDNLERMQSTLELAIELNCEFANFYSAMAYPGSHLYTLALKEGWPLPGNWSGYSQHAVDTLPLRTKHLSGAEVLRFRDRAFQVYFNNARFLKTIAVKFGAQAARDINKMASHRLERRN